MFIIPEFKRRALQGIKTLLALAILVILMMQLIGVVRNASIHYRRWLNRDHPHGNPMKVFKEIDSTITNENDPFLRKLMDNYHAPNPDN